MFILISDKRSYEEFIEILFEEPHAAHKDDSETMTWIRILNHLQERLHFFQRYVSKKLSGVEIERAHFKNNFMVICKTKERGFKNLKNHSQLQEIARDSTWSFSNKQLNSSVTDSRVVCTHMSVIFSI